MAHSHGAGGVPASKLTISICLTLAFVIGELVAGSLAHSLALISDAGHNFADALALVLSAYALWIARKPANPQKTFGYHRMGILAALVNAVSLVAIGLVIGGEAIGRLLQPEPVHGGPMIWVAMIAIVVNALIAFWLHGGSKEDINVRSAYLHMLGDAIAAFGVVMAGIVVILTGSSIADPAVSLLIAGLILWSSWGVLRESVNVLLEGTPEGVKMDGVITSVKNVPGVLDVHDLHVWTVGSGVNACSCHVRVADQGIRDGQSVLRVIKQELAHHHRISHVTVELEVEGCEAAELYCTLCPAASHNHNYAHAAHDH